MHSFPIIESYLKGKIIPAMKVTIITVTYNSERYLQSCITSVQKQKYPNIEHIIIDGNSDDNTLSIVKRNEESLSAWISEDDKGMYDAINKGMKLATGDIIGVLNSDDMLENSMVIQDIVDAFIENEVSVVYGDLKYVAQNDSKKVLRVWKGKKYNRNRFFGGWMPAHPTFYVKRNLVEEFGGYENHYQTAADYELMARYLFHHQVSAFYLDKFFVKMRIGGQSNSSIGNRFRANRRDYLAMKKNNIPFPFLVSLLKPLSKVHQFYAKA